MNIHNEFFKKVTSNKTLVDNMLMLKDDVWSNLSYRKRINCFESIINEISSLYEELGRPNFMFKLLSDDAAGEDSQDGTYLNIKLIEDGNPFEILATLLHEMRHYFQREADEIFTKTGIIHPLFTEDQMESIHTNLGRSMLYTASNYIYPSDINGNEYNLQPIEYDAENFSYEFMKRFKDEFLKEEIDIINCEAGNLGFINILQKHDENSDDIINFNKIYSYNYEDMINDNNVIFKKDRKKYDDYIKLLDKMNDLNDEQLFSLMGPAFLEQYKKETKCALINCYLEFNNSEDKILFDNGDYYFNGLLLDLNETSTYILMEPFFLHVADLKIKEIIKKDNASLTNIEKDIKINVMDEENIIKEESNPLLYRLQPHILYKYNFIKAEYLKMIHAIDKPYSGNFNYFMDFKIFLKKYDNLSINKKVEILYGKSAKEVYNDMISKMKKNSNKVNKTI